MAPRIGITTSYTEEEQRLPRQYIEAVEAAGGLPLLLPMARPATQDALMQEVDALVVPGGPAVDEGLVGSLPDDLDPLDPVRAASDAVYIRTCIAQRKPLLGICYGMQRLNALLGGTLYGDVEQQCASATAHSQKRGATGHEICIDETSRLYQILQERTVVVNTRHLQAIATVGNGLRVVATAPDGVVEAIEHTSGRMLGVQFHPERMGARMQPLFRDLVQQAALVGPPA
jgi:putative glutamine amidotransferase